MTDRRNFLLGMPRDLSNAIDAAAAAKKQSTTAWILSACRAKIPKDVRDNLSTPRRRGRPSKKPEDA